MIKNLLKISTVAAFAFAFVAAPVASAATMTITPTNLQGWTSEQPLADTRPGGSVTFSSDVGSATGLGTDALKIATTDGTAKAQMFKWLETSMPLSDLDTVSYNAYRASVSTGSAVQVASVNVTVDVNGAVAGGYTNLVLEPVYQTSQGPLVNDSWQLWGGGDDSIWWSSNSIPGAPNRDTFVSLASIKAANPDAIVLGYGFNQGSGNAGITSYVDGLTVNDITYNFELTAPKQVPAAKEDCKDGGWKGVVNAEGKDFKNQGQCVAYVASSDKSKHHRETVTLDQTI